MNEPKEVMAEIKTDALGQVIGSTIICPTCNHILDTLKKEKRCPICQQKLIWEKDIWKLK